MQQDFYGMPEGELARLAQFLGINRSTLHRWKKGTAQPPQSAVILARIWLNGELLHGGEDWARWRFTRDKRLLAPNGHAFTAAEVQNLTFYIRAARLGLNREPEQLRLF